MKEGKEERGGRGKFRERRRGEERQGEMQRRKKKVK